MARIEKTVFISYRRTNVPWALAISQSLTNNGYDVFFDFTGLASGDFEDVILENIHSRAHFLILLTPSALERCGHPGDWLRREIEAALDSKRNIVPLMLEGFDFSTPSIARYLTGKLALLKQYNGMTVPMEYFDAAMDKLRNKFLNAPLDAVLHPASFQARQAATKEKTAAAKAPYVAEEDLTAQEWLERGLNTTDFDEKIRLYSEAIRLKPDFSDAFCLRGIARKDIGNLEDALVDYEQAIRLDPTNPYSFNGRGDARWRKRDLDGAIEDYDRAMRLKPDFEDAFNNRGIVRREKGDLDGAIEDFNQAIRLKPDFEDAFSNRGIARSEKGDLDGGIEDFNQAIRLKPAFAGAFSNRGIARQRKGDLDGAIEDFNQAIRLKPDFANAFNNRGAAREAKGDLEGALADYAQAIRLEPNYTSSIENRDRVLKALADRSKS